MRNHVEPSPSVTISVGTCAGQSALGQRLSYPSQPWPPSPNILWLRCTDSRREVFRGYLARVKASAPCTCILLSSLFLNETINQGSSVVEALGEFTGGRLLHWHKDITGIRDLLKAFQCERSHTFTHFSPYAHADFDFIALYSS